MKILIVDDNEQYRKLLSAIFIDKGWEAIDAPEGRRGLELVQEHIPDVILSDIMMPRMDGFQFLHALRSSAFGDIIFIFYTSTYTKANHREFAQSLGADAYIAKPLDPEDIVQVLMDILDRKELRPARRAMPSEEEFFRLHSLFLSEKLMEKEAELQREAVQHLKVEKELTQLRERDRLREVSGLGIGLTAQAIPPAGPQQTLSSIEIADDVYIPIGRIETICRSLTTGGLPDNQGMRLVEKICSSIHKLRNLMAELQRNLLLPRSAVLAPIRRIQIMIDVLKKEYPGKGPSIGAAIEEMEGLFRKFAAYVEDLLRVANVAKQNLKYEPVDITSLVGEIVSRLRQASPHRQVQVEVQPGMMATGDVLLFKIALEQLLENAWNFTSEREEARIQVGCASEGDRKPVFFVRDNGIGFPSDGGKGIFKAFAKGTVRGDVGGSGIGLALARTVFRRHGGDIWGEGEPGRGAVFYFTCS